MIALKVLKSFSVLISIIVISSILSGCSFFGGYNCIFLDRFENYKNADLILAGRDTFIYKINSKLALADDTGGSTDHIKWVPEKMNIAEDSVNYGTECYSDMFDTIYCGDDYVVIMLIESKRFIVIDCNKAPSECISSYDDPNDIEIDYLNYPVINCLYPNELRQFN